ncbi:MAG: hypothetical protein SXU28_06550 [Pseudomonadota bacterium]|nr:hypothetical protein [Pseudomonadota bacterium]
MSKISVAILCIVIAGILIAMLMEVPYVTGGPGALVVIALVYSFVVARREAGLMAYALEQQREEERREKEAEAVIIPEWQR